MPTISLPEPLHAAAARRAAQAGYPSADAYVADLLRRDLEPKEPDFYLRRSLSESSDPASVTPEMLAQRKGEIEALLIEGLDSGPAVPMIPEDWTALRQRVESRLHKPNGK